MYSLFKHKYKVGRSGRTIFLQDAGKTSIEILVDVTDSRLTIKSIDERVAKKGIKIAVDYLKKNFGGKHIFCGVPEALQQHFIALGYTLDTQADVKTSRFRETFVSNLLGIKVDSVDNYAGLSFIQGEAIQAMSKESITNLMDKSGFLQEKIKQYQLQGYDGFQLMCQYSQPLGLKNDLDKLVAFCRVTELDNKTFYLSDTLIGEEVFEEKSSGTAYLYRKVGEALGDSTLRLLLIAPPGREEEFDKHYGCSPPSDVLVKFTTPQKELSQVFLDEKDRWLATSATLAQRPAV